MTASKRRTAAAGAAVLVLCGVSACGTDGPLGPPRAGDLLPDFAVTDLDGGQVRMAGFRGDALLLNLWATWCPPCRSEMPYLQRLQEEFGGQGLRVVGVSVDDPGARGVLEAFLEESGVGYDILLDPSMASLDLLGVIGLPATFVVDAGGVVTHVRLGPIAEGDESFLEQVRAVLRRDPAAVAVEAP